MVSVLVILGIVFTFQGIKKASDGLHKALSLSAVSPELPDQAEPGSAERVAKAMPVMAASQLPKPPTPVAAPQLQSEALQASIAESLGPLQSAFGANLYGIVFAIAILSLLGLQRHLSRIIEDDVDNLVHGELAEKVNELARKVSRRRKSQRLQATSSIDTRLRQLSDGMAALVASASGQQRAIEGIGDSAARRLSESVAPVLAAQLTPLLEAQGNALEAIAAATQDTAAQVANALAGTLKAQLTKVYDAESEHMVQASATVAASLGRVDQAQRLLAAATLSFAEIFHAGLAGHEEALALSLNANATAADALREARSSWAANLSLTDDLFARTSTIVDRLEAVARHVDEASTITGEGVSRMAAALGSLQQLSQELAPAAGGLNAAAQNLASLATSNAGQVVSAIGQASAATSQAASRLADEVAAVGNAVSRFGTQLEGAGREGAEDSQRAMNQTAANMANMIVQATAFLNQSAHVTSRLVEAAELLANSINANDHAPQSREPDGADPRAESRPIAFSANGETAESAHDSSRNPDISDPNAADS
jgi:hypothetical protein